ncbi:uncharacterized protein ACIB01_008577 [Guaruba guarouba]
MSFAEADECRVPTGNNRKIARRVGFRLQYFASITVAESGPGRKSSQKPPTICRTTEVATANHDFYCIGEKGRVLYTALPISVWENTTFSSQFNEKSAYLPRNLKEKTRLVNSRYYKSVYLLPKPLILIPEDLCITTSFKYEYLSAKFTSEWEKAVPCRQLPAVLSTSWHGRGRAGALSLQPKKPFPKYTTSLSTRSNFTPRPLLQPSSTPDPPVPTLPAPLRQALQAHSAQRPSLPGAARCFLSALTGHGLPSLSQSQRWMAQGSCVCPLRAQCPQRSSRPRCHKAAAACPGLGARSPQSPSPGPTAPRGPTPTAAWLGLTLPAAASRLLLRHPLAPGRGGAGSGRGRGGAGRGRAEPATGWGLLPTRGRSPLGLRPTAPPPERGLLPRARPHRDGAWSRSRRSPPATRLAQEGNRTPGPPPGNVPCDLTPGLPPAATARGAPRATEGNMSLTITLADGASSVANGGSGQVGRLCVLLPGPPEHIQLQEGGEDEGGLYQPPLSRPGGTLGTAGTAEQQMAQLKRRIEVTEEGMTKVMDMLQEMLTTICSLKTTVEGFERELHLLKDSFHKSGLEEMQERSVQQDEYSHILQSILDQLVEVRQELCRSSLRRTPTGEKPSSRELSPEASQELGHEASCRLSWMLEQHETAETHVSHHENQLQQCAESMTLEDIAVRLEKVPSEIKHWQDGGDKGLDFGREVLGQVRQLQKQCTRLQEAAERLWGGTKDTQKAGRAALKTKASQEELQHAMVQFSEMMQDLLQRMSQMDQNTQNALEKLLNEMDSKLDHVALAPLQAQLEQVRELIQQCLCQGSCNAGHAAGFKRQLSGPAKCISCNRPLAMAPAPPLVTIRKTCQLLQPQPASASNCLAQQLPESVSASHLEAMKKPQARTRHTTEKTARIPKYGSHYVSPYSRAAMQMKTSSPRGRWQTAMGSSRTSGV